MLQNCPANTTLYVPSNSTELSVTWTFPTATDNAGPVTVYNATYTNVDVVSLKVITITIDWQNGYTFVEVFHIGHYLHIITAMDAAGNTAQCMSHVWIIGEYRAALLDNIY